MFNIILEYRCKINVRKYASGIVFEVIKRILDLLIIFFYEKIPATQKHVTSKNQLTKKSKQKLNSKGNKFSHAQKLLGV